MTNASNCTAPIEFSELTGYWLDQLDAAAEARIEEHLFNCQECGAKLDQIIALAGAVRAAFGQGAVRAYVTDAFVKHLEQRNVRVREYRVPHNGSVNCTVTPDDEVIVSRLEAPLVGVSRVDAYSYVGSAEPQISRDIPFDPASGEVVVAPKIAQLRLAPSHIYRVRLVAVDGSRERVIGDYTFNHTRFIPRP
jgi:hypothetical protein